MSFLVKPEATVEWSHNFTLKDLRIGMAEKTPTGPEDFRACSQTVKLNITMLPGKEEGEVDSLKIVPCQAYLMDYSAFRRANPILNFKCNRESVGYVFRQERAYIIRISFGNEGGWRLDSDFEEMEYTFQSFNGSTMNNKDFVLPKELQCQAANCKNSSTSSTNAGGVLGQPRYS